MIARRSDSYFALRAGLANDFVQADRDFCARAGAGQFDRAEDDQGVLGVRFVVRGLADVVGGQRGVEESCGGSAGAGPVVAGPARRAGIADRVRDRLRGIAAFDGYATRRACSRSTDGPGCGTAFQPGVRRSDRRHRATLIHVRVSAFCRSGRTQRHAAHARADVSATSRWAALPASIRSSIWSWA